MARIKNIVEMPSAGTEDISFFDSLYNIVIAVDHGGRITVFNQACEKAFKVPAEEAMGRLITEVVPFTGLLKVLKTGKSHIGRKFVLDNRVYIANRTPVIKNGAVIGAVGVAQDITQLQQFIERKNFYKQALYTCKSILDDSGEGYLVISREGYIQLINKYMEELLGVEDVDYKGSHINELIDNSEMPLSPFNMDTYKTTITRGDKSIILIQHLVRQEDGTVSGFIVKGTEKMTKKHDSRCRSGKSGHRYSVCDFIGEDKKIKKLRETIRRVARGPSTVLITGESGTGKEIVAHALHAESPRKDGPFIKINCAAVPENLLEGELFGYCEGAFTGAKKGGHAGKFEKAAGGTILLDEIADMPLAMQAKLLRVIQDKEVDRLGDSKNRHVDVRVIASTNHDIEELVRQGKFREDLYYRLNVVNLHIPPIRERIEDLELLVRHFCSKFNEQFGVDIKGLSSEAWKIFKKYHWPGNVRELENIMERAFNLVESDYIQESDLPAYIKKAGNNDAAENTNNLPAIIEQVEKETLIRALQNNRGNKAKTAQELGISRAWLYKKMKYHNLSYN